VVPMVVPEDTNGPVRIEEPEKDVIDKKSESEASGDSITPEKFLSISDIDAPTEPESIPELDRNAGVIGNEIGFTKATGKFQDLLNCAKLKITITDKEHSPKLHASEHCLGWQADLSQAPVCDGKTFPMACTFVMKKEVNPEADSLIQAYLKQKAQAKDTPVDVVDIRHDANDDQTANVDASIDLDTDEELFQDIEKDSVDPDLFLLDAQGKRVKGKRDDQYMWAAKAVAKAEIHGNTCKPSTNGKRPIRTIDCDMCWAWFVPHPCNCNCRGWTQIAAVCVQPCSDGHGEHTHDSGLYCHKECSREGQLALNTGCGLGHDRVCTEGAGGCADRHFNRIWAAFDVAMFIGSLGSSAAITTSMKTARTLGMKAGLKALKSSLKKAAKKLAKKVAKKGWVKKQLKAYPASTQEAIMESGATMLLASNLPTDWGAVALEIAAALDPSGVIGFATGFVPPDSCDDSVYFKDPLPPATSGPDIGPLDGDTSRYSCTGDKSGMVVQIMGSGSHSAYGGGRWLNSNMREGGGMSWSGREYPEFNWKIEYDGALTNGGLVYIKDMRGNYFCSNVNEGGGMSWAKRRYPQYTWRLHWTGGGKLASGKQIFLQATYNDKYFASNYGENKGMSWMSWQNPIYTWTVRYDCNHETNIAPAHQSCSSAGLTLPVNEQECKNACYHQGFDGSYLVGNWGFSAGCFITVNGNSKGNCHWNTYTGAARPHAAYRQLCLGEKPKTIIASAHSKCTTGAPLDEHSCKTACDAEGHGGSYLVGNWGFSAGCFITVHGNSKGNCHWNTYTGAARPYAAYRQLCYA